MAKSIIQDKKECYFSKETGILENHHVFGGNANRKVSDKYGLTIWLTPLHHAEWHRSPPNAELNKVERQRIQQEVQRKAMEHYNWSIDEFRKKSGKSYI